MSYGFKVTVDGDYACFLRPETKDESISYDVSDTSALEHLLKLVYWKPAIDCAVNGIAAFDPADPDNNWTYD